MSTSVFVDGAFEKQFYQLQLSFRSILKVARNRILNHSKDKQKGDDSCLLFIWVMSSLESRFHGQTPTFCIEIVEPRSEDDIRKAIATTISENLDKMWVEEPPIL